MMNMLFLMDPLKKLHVETDTTIALMLAALRRGHNVYSVAKGGIIFREGKIYFDCHKAASCADKTPPFDLKQSKRLAANEVDLLFIRPDPPFDQEYLLATWLLDLITEKVVMINHPAGIRTASEKIWALQFPSLTPPTYIGRKKDDMLAFLAAHKTLIAKPTDGFGGRSVFIVREDDLNSHVIFETLSLKGTRDIILQKYIPQAAEGDKRILLLNGEPLGAVLRVHAKDDHRNNFCAGGTATKTQITARDRVIIATIKEYLICLGLYFVGIDILGDYLIEVNVTSPTCLLEMNALYNVQLEEPVIDFAEQLVAKGETKCPS